MSDHDSGDAVPFGLLLFSGMINEPPGWQRLVDEARESVWQDGTSK